VNGSKRLEAASPRKTHDNVKECDLWGSGILPLQKKWVTKRLEAASPRDDTKRLEAASPRDDTKRLEAASPRMEYPNKLSMIFGKDRKLSRYFSVDLRAVIW